MTPELHLKPNLRVLQTETVWSSSWAGSEAVQLYSGTPWSSLWTGPGVVCPAQLLPCTPALVSHIMIQDSLDSFLKGARHSPPEEKMIWECNLNSHQVFLLTEIRLWVRYGIDLACGPQMPINSTRRVISLSYNGLSGYRHATF